MRHVQRAQDQGIQYTKNQGVRADSQRQRQNGGNGEPGRLAQQSQAETQILHQRLKEIAAERFVAFLSKTRVSPELDAGAPFCLAAIYARALQIVGAVLDVRAKLLLHLLGDLDGMKKFSANRAKIGQDFHSSSG